MQGGKAMTFDEIKQNLMMLDNPVDRLEMVMDLGNSAAPVPDDAVCTEIQGCTSFVQICRRGNNFWVNADSVLVRGVATIIVAMVDGKTPDEIKKMDVAGEFAALNLGLGAARLNGVNSMIRFLQNL